MMRIFGLPDDYLETYTARVRAVQPDQVLAAARKYIDPTQAAIVAVGDADTIHKPMEKFGPVTLTREVR